MVWEFFKSLGRSRVTGVESRIKAKKYAVTAKAKSKAASRFNKAVDAPVKAARGKASAAAEGAKDRKMGLFGRKGKGTEAPTPEPMGPDDEGVEKTRALNVDEMFEPEIQAVVGWIVALEGEQKGRDFRLTSGKNVIGTSADCDVVLTDRYMSSRHATITYDSGRFTLVDLDSTNGSFVNDKKATREELIDNDTVRFGRTRLKFKSLY